MNAGVQKERMLPEDMYVMSPDGTVLSAPSAKGPPHKPPKCSECCPLFLKVWPLLSLSLSLSHSPSLGRVGALDECLFWCVQAYQMRNAGAVIHSHGLESCLATMIDPTAKEFRVCPID